jgi:hypothetical protein
MRALLFAIAALAACGDNQKSIQGDAGPQALTACVDKPDQLELPPTGQLPCELLPPGFAP